MRKSKFLAATYLGLALLASASVRAGWVEEVCAEHPKRDYCIATICEKAVGQCTRPAGSGGSSVLRIQSNGNTSGGHKHEGNKDNAAAIFRKYQEQARKAGEGLPATDSRSIRATPALQGRQ